MTLKQKRFLINSVVEYNTEDLYDIPPQFWG